MSPTPQGDETRRRIMDAVRNNPGIHKKEIRGAVGMGWGTIEYQVVALRKAKLLQLHNYRGETNCFDIGVPEEEVRWFQGLRVRHAREIIRVLDKEGELRAHVIADGLEKSRKIIRNSLKHMHNRTLVSKRGGRNALYGLPRRARAWLGSRAFLPR